LIDRDDMEWVMDSEKEKTRTRAKSYNNYSAAALEH